MKAFRTIWIKSNIKRDRITQDTKTWIKLQEYIYTDHHVDTNFKTVMQLGQRSNTAISQGNGNDQYGP